MTTAPLEPFNFVGRCPGLVAIFERRMAALREAGATDLSAYGEADLLADVAEIEAGIVWTEEPITEEEYRKSVRR